MPIGIMDSRVQNVPRVHPASYCRVWGCCTLESTVPIGTMDSRVQNVPRVHPASYTGSHDRVLPLAQNR